MVRWLLHFGADSAKKDSSGRDWQGLGLPGSSESQGKATEAKLLRSRPYSLRLRQDQASDR